MKKQVIVTTSWDDGHMLDLKLAKLLKKYGIKGTFYVSPQNREFRRNHLLTNRDILDLSRDFEIGAHTMTHPRLTRVSEDKASYEITESKKYLEKIISKEVMCFSYPEGKYNNRIKDQVKRAGFIGARTTCQMITTDSKDLFEIGTTIQEYPLSYRGVLGEIKYAIKNNANLIPLLFTKDWSKVAMNTFDYVNENGGIWHLWGHSWMADKYDDWDKLELVLRYVSRKSEILYLSNSKTIVDKFSKVIN